MNLSADNSDFLIGNSTCYIGLFYAVGFADEPPTWGHPPDPKVQSKSFKMLQRHLQEHEDDGMCRCVNEKRCLWFIIYFPNSVAHRAVTNF